MAVNGPAAENCQPAEADPDDESPAAKGLGLWSG